MGSVARIKNKIIQRIGRRLSEQNYISKQVRIGKNTWVSGAIINGAVSIGNNCKIYRCEIDGNVSIGRRTSVWGPNTTIISKVNLISIGNFCSVARNVSIQEYDHRVDTMSTYYVQKNILNDHSFSFLRSKGSVKIGHDVWIGTGAVILSGVKVGNGAIIAANSTITKDVPDFSVVGGNPGRVLKYRFEPEIMALINRINWWDWEDSKIKENSKLFDSTITKKMLIKYINQ